MQDDPYVPQPFDPSGKIYPEQMYPSGQPSYPARQPYPPGQSPFASGQPYPPQAQPYPGQQSYQPYPPQAQPYPGQQPYPPKQAFYAPPAPPQPNRTTVIVNTSQQVNSGCGTWVWVVLGVLVVLILACVGIPLLGGGIGALSIMSSEKQLTAVAGTPIVGTQHHKVGEAVNVTWREGYVLSQERITVTSFKPATVQDKPGKKYAILNIEATNLHEDDDIIDSRRFTLIDDTGQKCQEDYLPAFSSYSGNIAAKSTVRGGIVYLIPPNNHTFTLNLVPNIGGTGPLYSWDLQL